MIRRQRREPAGTGHELGRAAVGPHERHVDERDLAGPEVDAAPLEREVVRWFPRGDGAGLVHARAVAALVLLEQAAADLGLEHELRRAAARDPIRDAPAPPEIDLG